MRVGMNKLMAFIVGAGEKVSPFRPVSKEARWPLWDGKGAVMRYRRKKKATGVYSGLPTVDSEEPVSML